MLDLFLPGRQVVFQSPLSLDEAISRLQSEVAAPASPFGDRRTQLFEGTFADGRFRIMRLVKGRNSFRPVIDGVVCQGAHGARIDSRLRMHPLVLVFCLALTLIGGTIAALAAPELPFVTDSPLAARLIAMALMILLFGVAVSFEARKAIRLLSEVFAAPPLSNAAQSPTRTGSC